MWNLSLKIYGSANATLITLALVLAIFSPLLFVWTVFFSLLVSLPAIPALYSVLNFIEQRKPPILMCWIIVLLSIIAISLLLVIIFSTLAGDSSWGDQLFAVSMLAGFAGVCLNSASIHDFFLHVKYGSYEND